jgi:hypothetical protein
LRTTSAAARSWSGLAKAYLRRRGLLELERLAVEVDAAARPVVQPGRVVPPLAIFTRQASTTGFVSMKRKPASR